MAWVTIPKKTNWEYDDNPSDPGGNETSLWALSSNGIRTNSDGTQIYIKCRKKGDTITEMNEINKTYLDNL